MNREEAEEFRRKTRERLLREKKEADDVAERKRIEEEEKRRIERGTVGDQVKKGLKKGLRELLK